MVLSGTLTLGLADGERELGPNECVRVAPGVRRQIMNRGRERCVLLAIGGAEAHNGRDGIAFDEWDSPEGRSPQDAPMPGLPVDPICRCRSNVRRAWRAWESSPHPTGRGCCGRKDHGRLARARTCRPRVAHRRCRGGGRRAHHRRGRQSGRPHLPRDADARGRGGRRRPPLHGRGHRSRPGAAERRRRLGSRRLRREDRAQRRGLRRAAVQRARGGLRPPRPAARRAGVPRARLRAHGAAADRDGRAAAGERVLRRADAGRHRPHGQPRHRASCRRPGSTSASTPAPAASTSCSTARAIAPRCARRGWRST